MIDAAGSYSDLSNGFNSVGGTDMSTAHLAYWSSTESTGNFAWAFGFGDWLGGHEWLDAQKDTNTYSIRACLVF